MRPGSRSNVYCEHLTFTRRRGAHRSCAEAQQRARASVEVSRVAIDCGGRGNLGLGGDRHVATNELTMRLSVVADGRVHA